MEVYIGVPVKLAAKLDKNVAYGITINSQLYQARLLTIAADVQPMTRTVLLRLQLPQDAQVFNGDLAQLSLAETVTAAGYWLPAVALTDGIRGLWAVYVIKQAQQGQAFIEKRDVQILYAESIRFFVSGAIENGEQVVSGGLQRLVPGQKVRLAKAINQNSRYSL